LVFIIRITTEEWRTYRANKQATNEPTKTNKEINPMERCSSEDGRYSRFNRSRRYMTMLLRTRHLNLSCNRRIHCTPSILFL